MRFTGLFFLGAATSALGAAVNVHRPPIRPDPAGQPKPGPGSRRAPGCKPRGIPQNIATGQPSICGPHGPGGVGNKFELYAEEAEAHVTNIQAYLSPIGLAGIQLTFSNGETKTAGVNTGITRTCVIDQRLSEVSVSSAGAGISQLYIQKADSSICNLGYDTGARNTCGNQMLRDGVLAGLQGEAGGFLSSLGLGFY
ncbi:hypothetical protein BDV59DRAFT_196774 [Aspergillus ambiguus]|uniref:uncharacterized protein n=1 Tax=Aspergillus ambiguus TaxID=176160 RepID=UPI003CCD9228